MNKNDLKQLEKEITDNVARCWKCRMWVDMCPTYEGWLTKSPAGRLMAINLHIKQGLGSMKDLSDLLYSCTTCRRCQVRCEQLSTNCNPTDTIIKARQYFVNKAQSEGGKE
jgi:Fe-S oxidoreductase